MDSTQMKVVVTGVLKNQIPSKGGAEVNKDLLKAVPFSFKKGYYQIPKLGELAIHLPEENPWEDKQSESSLFRDPEYEAYISHDEKTVRMM